MSSFSISSFDGRILSSFINKDRISKLPDDLLAKIFVEVVPENNCKRDDISALPLVSKRFEKITMSEQFYCQLIQRQFPFAKDFKIGLIGAKVLYKLLNTMPTIIFCKSVSESKAKAQLELVKILLSKGMIEEAKVIIVQMTSVLQTKEQAQQELVNVLLSKGMIEEAKDIIAQMTSELQVKERAQHGLVKVLLSKGMIEEAKDIIAQITDRLFKNLAIYELVKVLFSKGMSEEANDIIAQLDNDGKFVVLTKRVIEEANDITQLTESYRRNRAQIFSQKKEG